MNILISVNDNFVNQAITMLYSLRMNFRGGVNVFHLSITISENGLKTLQEFVEEKLNGRFISIKPDDAFLKELPLYSKRFSIETYSRIIAQDVLPSEVDRILWLDADMIICKDIEEFYNMGFGNKAIICAADLRQDALAAHKSNLGISQGDIYFNAGVILFNLNKLRLEYPKNKVYECIKEIEAELIYQDQDILNVLYSQDKKIVDYKVYNYQLDCEKNIPKELIGNIVVLHYTGKAKPWIYRNIAPSSMPYWNVVRKMGGA